MKQNRKAKPPWRMTGQELAQATREFDAPAVADSFSRPAQTERKRWARAKRKAGRPRVGKGVKIIAVSVEKDLLKRSDALARSLGLSRAALIALGLNKVLAGKDRAS